MEQSTNTVDLFKCNSEVVKLFFYFTTFHYCTAFIIVTNYVADKHFIYKTHDQTAAYSLICNNYPIM